MNPGDTGGEATPVPIPNTEVKLSSAEDTERAAFRENRSSPGFLRFFDNSLGHAGVDRLSLARRTSEPAAAVLQPASARAPAACARAPAGRAVCANAPRRPFRMAMLSSMTAPVGRLGSVPDPG